VECQLETLRKCLSALAIRKTLSTLPKTLDETYDRILCNIPEEYHKEAGSVLQLLAVSFRPLTLEEVAEAIAIDSETEVFRVENRLQDPEDVLGICSSLVTLSGCEYNINVANFLGESYALPTIQ
jgi:hypothetical protein